MQAVLTLAPDLRAIPKALSKISKDVYYDEQASRFYKLTVLQPLTLFIGQDVVIRQNLVLTSYDPSYLILAQLAESPTARVEHMHPHFTSAMFDQFCDLSDSTYKVNKDKIAKFLQARIDAANALIQERGYHAKVKKFQTTLKIKEQGKRSLSQDVIEILKKDIPQIFLEEVVRSKYEQEKLIKHVVQDTFAEELDREDEHDRNKIKKKPAPKPKQPQPLPKNQMTLLQFSGKKQ